MQKIKSLLSKFILVSKAWSLRRKIFYALLTLITMFILVKILSPKDYSSLVTTDTAKVQNLKETVLATGQVTSNTDLNLSFNTSGIVKKVMVKVGDKVKEGQVLAMLDNGSASAALTQARGALAAANAKYKKTLEGATSEEVKLAEVALANAKQAYIDDENEQTVLVDNAYKKLLNSEPGAYPYSGSSDVELPEISGSYNLGKEGVMKLSIYYTGSGTQFNVTGLTTGNGKVNTTSPQAIGDSGLYITFPSTNNLSVLDWVIEIPNKKSSTYVTNFNAYNSALKTKESVLSSARALISQREAELAIKKAGARGSDIDLTKADIISAQGQLESAQASYENTIIKAPANGTITSVDIKYGELAQAQKEAIVLQDVDNIYIEANINETNISKIVIGQDVAITFDAFGTDKISYGKVYGIDPASTTTDGIVNYKIQIAQNEKDPMVKPGMNANLDIKIFEKPGVLVVPMVSIVKRDGASFARLITNTKRKTYKEVPVSIGVSGDGNLVEILSGLQAGDEVVVLDKSK